MARILVTDGEQRSSLAVVRSLGRSGHEVLVCSARRRSLAGASRFARRSRTVADPLTDPEAFRRDVVRIVEEDQVDVLLPMTDTSLPILLGIRETHPSLRLPFASFDTYEAVSDKRHLMDVASAVGVPVPAQLVVERHAGAEGFDLDEQRVPFRPDAPVVLKPARSAVVGATGIHRFGVRMLDRSAELPAALADFPPEAFPILVQERITGPGLGAFLLADRGRIVAAFGHRRIREKPPTGGVSVYRESLVLRPDIRAHAERLLREFDWSGVAMVEFKEDATTGTAYLMEINGRFWGSLQLAIDAEVDFPRLLVDLAMDEVVDPVSEGKTGVRSRWLWGDVDHLLWMLIHGRRAGATDPTLPSPLTALARFLVPWRPGDRFEVLRFTDPAPFVRESLDWFGALRNR